MPESVLKGLESEPKITDFTLINEIGSGSFGRVLLVQHKKTGVTYAIKAIDKRTQANIQDQKYFRREIEIMYRVHHPNVVKLYGHFEDNTYCYFVMEYIDGGNVYTLVPKNGLRTVSAQQVASIIKDVISATYYLHHMSPPIIHRDIKPENVLLNSGMRAKLTDFGWSNYMKYGCKRLTVCGTPIYLAPEMINNTGHDEKVDIWCIGILLYELVTGSQPWQGADIPSVKDSIRGIKIKWPPNVDRLAADLICKILKYNPEERITLRNMLNHPFITQYFPNATSCLIRPDINAQYQVYVISKDHPSTWNPIVTNVDYGLQYNSYYDIGDQNQNPNTIQYYTQTQTTNKNDYDALLEKYNKLQREYTQLKIAGLSSMNLDGLRRELKEKEEKINQILSKINASNNTNTNTNVNTNYYYSNNNQFKNYYNVTALETTYNDLKNENYNLKNKLNIYQTQYNTQSSPLFIDNYLNDLRNSIKQNNKYEFSNSIYQLRTDLDNATIENYNTIIMMKDREIERYKEQERQRREREKRYFSNLINRYDQTLTLGEQENQQLKMRLKELQGYFV